MELVSNGGKEVKNVIHQDMDSNVDTGSNSKNINFVQNSVHYGQPIKGVGKRKQGRRYPSFLKAKISKLPVLNELV